LCVDVPAGSVASLAARSGADADGALPDADLLTFEFGLFQVCVVLLLLLVVHGWLTDGFLYLLHASCLLHLLEWLGPADTPFVYKYQLAVELVAMIGKTVAGVNNG
jgi:hypothetical protein